MKRIVICGSIQFIETMKLLSRSLEKSGFVAITPNEDGGGNIPPEKTNEYKRRASLRYFNEVAHPDTYAVLVTNETKKNIVNYIGANTFAEIAIAFFHGKKIFLLNEIYEPFADELAAWGAIPLHGEINDLK